MSAAVPLKVMVASAVPSPVVKLRPVVWLSVILPLVTVSVSVNGSAAPLPWMDSFCLSALEKVSNWVSPTTCRPGLYSIWIGWPLRTALLPWSTSNTRPPSKTMPLGL